MQNPPFGSIIGIAKKKRAACRPRDSGRVIDPETSLVLPGRTPSYHESNEGRAKGSNPFPTVLRLRSLAQDITSPNGEWDLFKKLVNLVD